MKKDGYLLPFVSIIALFAAPVSGYAANAKVAAVTAEPAKTAAPARVEQQRPQATAAAAKVLTGKVEETMDSGGYTYIRLVRNELHIWVAVPKMRIKVGDVVEIASGTRITNFTSRTLNRTFERIVFADSVVLKR